MEGRRIAQFLVLERLGAGGMGVVHRGHDERLRRDVALKFLKPGLLEGEQARRRFHREALSLSRLNHPSLATLHDFITEGDQDVLVMEYIAGETLDVVVARGAIDEARVIELGVQIAEGLGAAHRAGIIHRDLKPGNLRLTPDGRLKILDFGLAKALAADSGSPPSEALTEALDVVGTPHYIAPEMLRGETITERSDIYGLGVVLYELATGGRPFPALAGAALFSAILHGEIPPVRVRNPLISTGLEAVILGCLHKAPSQRFESAAAVASALRALRTGTASTPPPPLPGGRRRLALAALVGLAAVIVAAVLWTGWWRGFVPGGAVAGELRSLAVLPFANLSGSPDQEYLADAFTEELIGQLSRVSALRVISRTSVMRYKQQRPPLPQIARDLNVEGAVDGSVMRAQGRVRITVQLLDARRDMHLWSAEHEADTTDLFGLQRRLAREIVQEIQVRLTANERRSLRQKDAVNPGAYAAYLRGRHEWNRRTPAGIRSAIGLFEEALRHDSTYARGWAGLADARTASALYGLEAPRSVLPGARAAALRAVRLDPQSSEAHGALGNVLQNLEWDWARAGRELTMAVELNPNDAIAHHRLGFHLALQGRLDSAEVSLRRALELDPVSSVTRSAFGVLSYYRRDHARAVRYYLEAARLDSTHGSLFRPLAGAYDRLGDSDRAIAALARSFELQGQAAVAAGLRQTYRKAGFSGAVELLVAGMLQKRAMGAYEPAVHLAELYLRLGRTDEAFRWLDIALNERDTELNRLGVDPLFDSIRQDPRFAPLVAAVGLVGSP